MTDEELEAIKRRLEEFRSERQRWRDGALNSGTALVTERRFQRHAEDDVAALLAEVVRLRETLKEADHKLMAFALGLDHLGMHDLAREVAEWEATTIKSVLRGEAEHTT